MQDVLIVYGLNYKTAPVEIREKIFFSKKKLAQALQDFSNYTGLNHVVILSTCHRTDIYTQINLSEETEKISKIAEWLLKMQNLQPHENHENITAYFYLYKHQEAMKHVLRVASGIDSMITGETQVFGQLKTAVDMARQAGTLGNQQKKFFEHVFSSAKTIRTQTAIGSYSACLGKVITKLARTIFEYPEKCQVLLIGAGEIMAFVAEYFITQGIKKFCIANRTKENAEKLALLLNISDPDRAVMPLDKIHERLHEFDIVMTAIDYPLPLIGKGLVETALKRRKHRPMLMIDMAVPRNIESEISVLQDAYFYHIDDLQNVLQDNHQKKNQAIQSANRLIDDYTEKFCTILTVMQKVAVIQKYRQKVIKIREEILQKTLKNLSSGMPLEQALTKMAYLLANKLAHDPCIWLKQAVADNYQALIKMVEKS